MPLVRSNQKLADLREHDALVGDRRRQDDVERRQPVAGDDEHLVGSVLVDVAHLAAAEQVPGGLVGLVQRRHGRLAPFEAMRSRRASAAARGPPDSLPGQSQLRAQLADEHAGPERRRERRAASASCCSGAAAGRRIGEVAVHEAGGRGRALGHGRALRGRRPARPLAARRSTTGCSSSTVLVVVGVQEEVHGVAAEHVVQRGHRQDDAGVDLLRAHDDGPVDLAEGVALLQVVEADEGADLGAVAQQLAVGVDLQRAHVVGDDAQPRGCGRRPRRATPRATRDLPVAVSPMRSTLAAAAVGQDSHAVMAPWNGMRPRFMAATLCSVSTIFLR